MKKKLAERNKIRDRSHEKPQVVKEPVESGHVVKETDESLVYKAKVAIHEADKEGDKVKVRQLEKDLVKLCDDIADSNSNKKTKKHHGNKKA